MSKCLAGLLVLGMSVSAGCGSDSPAQPDGMEPDAPPPPIDGPDAGDGQCGGGVQRRGELAGFAPFSRSQARWATAMAAGSQQPGKAPYPPMQAADDPATYTFLLQYQSAYTTVRPATGVLPFGLPAPIVSPDDDVSLRARSSLILAADDPGALLRLTDFSTSRPGRFAAACDTFLAGWTVDARVTPLRRLCDQLGTPVHTDDVHDLKVDAIRLLRGKECALPSLAYGALPPDGQLAFRWPDFSQRAAAVQQPCVGAFVHVSARGALDAPLGAGWLFTKAAADLATVPFPYLERDPVNGALPAPDGAPRGEYVSTRQVFDSGVSIYLGTSPVWLVTGAVLQQPLDQLAAHFDAGAPVCDLSQAAPAAPCILPPQKPFLYPTSRASLWLRQVLDATAVGFKPRAALDRNPNELHTGDVFLGTMLTQMLRLLNATDFASLDATALADLAERLGAVFHAFRAYQGRVDDLARLRLSVIELEGGYGLVIPDQGYLDVGSPTAELYQRLAATDLDRALDLTAANCGGEAFTFRDLAPR